MDLANVGMPGQAYLEMEKAGEWKRIAAFERGTSAIRNKEYLPQNPRESDKAYALRVELSYLFPGFTGAIDAITALPFQKPVTVEPGGTLDEKLALLETDCDRQGTRLHDFLHMLDEEACTFGIVHILVDYPALQAVPNQAEEKEYDIRPYFCAISPRNLIRFPTARDATGKRTLASIAIREDEIEPEAQGGFKEVKVQYIREITATTWRRWRKLENAADWTLVGEGTHSFGEIPLVSIPYNSTGFMTALPPYLDLLWANDRHLKSESAQDTALQFARIPVLFGAGFSSEEVKTINDIGPGQGIFSKDPAAKLGTVEHSGAAIEAGRLHGRDIIDQMVSLGAQPLIETTSTTATGEQRQDRRATSKRQEWVNTLSNGAVAAYRLAAKVIGKELPKKFAVNINGDFILSAQAQLHLQALQFARTNRDISQPTYVAELKKRGALGANVDAKKEQELVAQEPDAFGGGMPTDPPEDPKEDEGDGEQGPPKKDKEAA